MPYLQYLQEVFSVTYDNLLKLSDVFCESIRESNNGIRLLNSFFTRSSGKEQGKIIVLDFGGTNLRLFLIELFGNGTFTIYKNTVINLREQQFNILSGDMEADELFTFIAQEIKAFIVPEEQYIMGHCFSFAAQQISQSSTLLINWTKEINIRSTIGQDINDLLRKALIKCGVKNVTVTAIINDAVGVILATSYQRIEDTPVTIGSICGTGHNSCLIREDGAIISLESGNFSSGSLPFNEFDEELNRQTSVGTQRFEKMVAGAYLGELARLVLKKMVTEQPWLSNAQLEMLLSNVNSISSKDLAYLLGQNDKNTNNGGQPDLLDLVQSSSEVFHAAKVIARLLVERSAKLIASTYAGIIKYMDPDLTEPHLIAVDGSLYEKMPFFSDIIDDTLHLILGPDSENIRIILNKNGSGVGAAVASVMALPSLEV